MPPKDKNSAKAAALPAAALAAAAGAAVGGSADGADAPLDSPSTPTTSSQAALELSAAAAAKAVKRVVPVVKDGQPTGETEEVEVTEAEVFDWSLRGETVTVVTTDGQKLVGSL